MNRLIVIGILVMLLGTISGCKKDESSTPPILPPGTVSEVEPNDVTPQNLGTLGSQDLVVSGAAANATDVDRFSIRISSATNLLAKVAWTGAADLDLSVMDSTGIMLTFRDTGQNPESCTLTSRPPGTYIIQVTSKSNSATSYTLTIGPR